MTRQTLQLSVRLLVLLIALSLVFLFVNSRPAEADSPVRTVEHVVVAGDTLWAIASAAGENVDTRAVIMAIKELNGLRDGLIHPGQVLLIPQG